MKQIEAGMPILISNRINFETIEEIRKVTRQENNSLQDLIVNMAAPNIGAFNL